MQLVIRTDGSMTCLYSETLALAALGQLSIQRASHVEPDATGQWYADIIDGPTLGPYPLRSEALAAEREWLETNALCRQANAITCD